MKGQFGIKAATCALGVFCLVSAPHAQAPAPAAQPPAPPVSTAVAAPTYVSIPLEIAVNRPAAEVWKRVGKYCDIGEWLRIPCTITSGKDGEFGAVRSVANEVLVGKTELSYTYTQPVREGRPYNLYHGTLEARPVTATTSKLVYTLFFDNSMLADDAGARSRQSAEGRRVHDCAREHEDPGRGRYPASGTSTRDAAGRRSDGSVKNGRRDETRAVDIPCSGRRRVRHVASPSTAASAPPALRLPLPRRRPTPCARGTTVPQSEPSWTLCRG